MFNKICPFVLLLLISGFSLAQEKTFLREYTYPVDDADSKITARAIALNQVKKTLLEEIGVYMESTFEMKTTETDKEIEELTKSQIVSITAGITKTKIIDEQWNGEEFYIKAEITLDVGDVRKKVSQIAKDRDKTKQLEDANIRAEKAFLALNIIKEKLKKTNSEKEKLLLQLQYVNKSNVLTTTDLLQKSNDAFLSNEYTLAIRYLEKAVEIDPTFAEAYNDMGVIYENKNNFTKAILCYEKAIKINPNNGRANYNLATMYAKKRNFDNAIIHYKRAIEIFPIFSEAYGNLGIVYGAKGDNDKAIQCYKKAIEINPNNANTYYNMGNAYGDKNNIGKEIECYNKAILVEPTFYKAFYNMGLAYSKLGNIDKELECYKKTIELNPNSEEAYYNMGSILKDKGDNENALKCYQKVIEINPTDADSHLLIGTIYGMRGNMKVANRYILKAAQLGSKAAQDFLLKSGINW